MRVLSCEKSLYLEYGPSIYHTKSPEIEIEREKKKKKFIMRGRVVGKWEGNFGGGIVITVVSFSFRFFFFLLPHFDLMCYV